MSGSGYKHHSHHRRRGIRGFFDRLTGKKDPVRSSHHHVSGFPGINLPRDFDPNQLEVRPDEAKTPTGENIPRPDKSRDFSGPIPENIEVFKSGSSKFKPVKRGLFESLAYYFKKRALRKEERRKERMKRKIKRQHQKEYRKQEAGRSFLKKLFTWQREVDEFGRAKGFRLFSQSSTLYRNMTITVNSLMIFLATYVLAYLFYWLTSMLVASWYGLDSTLYYYDLKFNDHSNMWNRFNILLVTGIPPFMCLSLGLFLWRVVFKKSRFAGLQKLFILWSAFHLINHFFGAFPSGVVTAEGFGYVAAWLYMNTAFKFMFSIISLFILGLIGFYAAEQILETSDSMSRIKPEYRVSFILTQMALPWLIGTIILLLLRLPKTFDYPYETLMFFSMAFMVIPPFFNEKVKPKLNLLKVKKKRNIHLGYLVMMLALVSFLRIMLGIGLHFLIEINISITPAGL
jgi:hypothetical protein